VNTMFHVIDDDTTLSSLMVELLESDGYQAVGYSSPIEYLHFVESKYYIPPVAVITDVRMPEMSGYELIDKLRELFPKQRAVVVSGDDTGDRAANRDICHFLSKPIAPETLFDLAALITKCDQMKTADAQCHKLAGLPCSALDCHPQDCFIVDHA